MTSPELDAALDRARKATQAGHFTAARDAWEAALELDPAHLGALQGAMYASHQINDTRKPIEYCERARAAAPESEHVYAMLSEALMGDQKPQEAFEIARDALERFPDNNHFRVQVGRGWQMLGDMEKAREAFWIASEKDTGSTDALYYLTRIGDKRDLARLDTLLTEAWAKLDTLEPLVQLMLAFARASLAEKQGRFDDAWDLYVRGNEIQRRMVFFDEDAFVRNMALHLELFGRAQPAPQSEDDIGKEFVFIVSLPRSGSTLTEQILASHSRVKAIGERTLSFEAFHHWRDNRTPQAFVEARAMYINGARKLAGLAEGENAVIVDKSITNYVYLGFLHKLLPRAKFVHVVRAPMDAAVSCYATPFGLSALKWCHDLETIGRTFRRYQKLMKTWCRLWPDDILTLSYEDLTADPEARVRELLAFCDLEWEPACLEFHKGKRQVATASASQVRQPIYQTAKGRAAPFDAHLEPLKKILGRAADPDWHSKR